MMERHQRQPHPTNYHAQQQPQQYPSQQQTNPKQSNVSLQ
jgi:hypothetical protein